MQESKATSQNVKPKLPWAYNHLHDLESLWWVAVCIISNNRFSMSGDSDVQEIPEHHRKALFPLAWEPFRRATNFTEDFPNMKNSLPKCYQQVFTALDGFRELLIQHYRDVKSKLPHSINLDASDDDIYQFFAEVL